MVTPRKLLLVIACLMAVLIAKAQTVSTSHPVDTSKINNYEQGLIKVLEQLQSDSIRRISLENKLLDIRINDEKEIQKLRNEINILRSRDSILFQKRKQTVDSLRTLNQGVAVAPFQDTIFVVYNRLGSYTKKERAEAIEDRIRALYLNYAFDPDSLQLQEAENNWIVVWRDQMIVSVNDQDALWADIPKEQLAKNYLKKIQNSIRLHRDANSFKNITKGVFFAALIVSVLIALLIGISRLMRFVKIKIVTLVRKKVMGNLNARGYRFITSDKLIRFLWLILTVIKWLLMLVAIYLALPMILNQFAATKGFAPVLLNYFINPIKDILWAVIDYLPDLATVLVILLIFRYVLKLLRYIATELDKGELQISGFYKEWAIPTYEILRAMLFAFILIVIFPYLPGSDSPVFKGVSVFAGILFTFSSAGALSNIVAGLLLTYMRSFSVGDRIKIGDVSGDIIERTLLVTRIRTIKNEIISIPNSQMMNNHTINYSTDVEKHPLIINTTITISYDVPWQQVHSLAKKACDQVELLEKQPEPFVLQLSLNDYYVTYQINAYTHHPHKQSLIYSELLKHILDVFHEAGIELISPSFHAVRDGSQKVVPDEHKGNEGFMHPIQLELFRKNNKNNRPGNPH